MARGLTSAVKTALAASPSFCHLVYLGFGTPVRKTDNAFDIIEKGFHLFTEKPMAPTVEQGKKLVDLSHHLSLINKLIF